MKIQYDIASYLERQPKPGLIIFAFSISAFLEFLNYFFGHELRLVIFHFVPLYLLIWFVRTRWAILLAIASSFSWYIVGRLALDIYLPGYTWNALTRLAIFIIFIYMVNAYKRERIFAREDFLTKIANNQHFAEISGMEIERCRRYGHPFSLVYIDVDNFKAVNDNFGHSTGNELLYEVAQGIRINIRASDMVARLGGDEFAILLPETGYDQAGAIIPKLREKLISLMQEHKWPATFSFGMATFIKAPENFDEMVRQADILMYQAKNEGKDTIRSGIYR
ncbi:MAG: GGDEF domain-containing protein [Syntrophaceae bacterium]